MSVNTSHNSLNEMVLGYLGQSNEIYFDARTYTVLWICVIMSGLIFLFTLYIYLLNTYPQFLLKSPGVFWVFGDLFAFSVFLFCHLIGGRDSLKKWKIHEERARVYRYKYIHTLTHTHTHTHIHTHMYTYIHTNIMYTQIHTYTYTHTFIHKNM